MARLVVRLFGAFEVTLDGTPLTSFESGKVRLLLAFLACEAGEAHARASLADLLWPDQGEERARRSLSQALYNLRTVLGEPAAKVPLLVITPETIRLSPAADIHVDVTEFSRLLQDCDRHAHRRVESCPDCQKRYAQAALLYRGDFLAGIDTGNSIPVEEWLLRRRESYRQSARRLLASLADWRERTGDIDQALQAARQLFELDPCDDSACQGLMRLLSSTGQRAEALAVYERFRRALRTELDMEPAAETQSLYLHIRSQAEGLPLPFAHRHNLPASLAPLIGREVELVEVQQRLLEPTNRLLTILGPGGSGKSRLALEAARGLLDRFADGVYLVPFSPLVSLESLLPAIASATGLPLQEKKQPQAQLQDYLRGREMLLVLDGCESLLEAAPLLVDLLRHAPDLKLLATSRTRLNIAKEETYPLGGLMVESSGDAVEDAHCAAVRLFASAARRLRPGFEVGVHNLEAVLAICAQVQGMPLAILLAAAWVEVLSPGEILEEMRSSLDFLRADWADLPPRQRSMRLTFDYSWNLLDEDEKRLFRGLCVFCGAFTRQAAQAVADAGIADLRRLADKSLLMPITGEWYAVHELLRQFGLERLAQDAQESMRVYQSYSMYYLGKLREWEPGLKGARRVETLALLDAKSNDLRLAWELACQRLDIERLAGALDCLCLYYHLRARLKEGASACQYTLEKLEARGDSSVLHLQARLLTWQSRFYRLLGETSLASGSLERCKRMMDELAGAGLDLRLTRAMFLLESAETIFTADLAEANRLLQDALRLARASGDKWQTANLVCRLGMNRHHTGDYPGAGQALEEALQLFLALGSVQGVGHTRQMIAQNLMRSGKLESAMQLMDQVIADSHLTPDRYATFMNLRTLGVLMTANGRYAEAERLLQESLSLAEELGGLYDITFTSLVLGLTLQMTGQYARCRALIERAAVFALDNHFKRETASCAWSQASILLAGQSPLKALPRYLESIQLYRMVGHPEEMCWALAMAAFCLLQSGEVEDASRYLGEALPVVLSIRGYFSSLFVLAACAAWLAARGEAQAALELYTLAAIQPVFAHSTWFRDVFGECMQSCDRQLEPHLAEAARQRGAQRSIWDALAEMQARMGKDV